MHTVKRIVLDDRVEYRFNDKPHRTDGPAIEYADGTKAWWLNGKLHREDGPAIEYADNDKAWYLNGELHRKDGPAIEWPDGTKQWWLNGERHREDGPAVENADGSKEWWLNGKLHREDGPAAENSDGSKEWYLNGELHREDGPAVERVNGDTEWWLNGERCSEKKQILRNVARNPVKVRNYCLGVIPLLRANTNKIKEAGVNPNINNEFSSHLGRLNSWCADIKQDDGSNADVLLENGLKYISSYTAFVRDLFPYNDLSTHRLLCWQTGAEDISEAIKELHQLKRQELLGVDTLSGEQQKKTVRMK